MVHVIDAHVLIWSLERNPKVSATARTILWDPLRRVVVPSIALVEICRRDGRGKIQTSWADARALIDSSSNAVIAPLGEPVLTRLPDGPEVHDAIIVATAQVIGAGRSVPVRVVTRDRQVTLSGMVDVVW